MKSCMRRMLLLHFVYGIKTSSFILVFIKIDSPSDPQSSVLWGNINFLKGIAFLCKYLPFSPSGSDFLVPIGAQNTAVN